MIPGTLFFDREFVFHDQDEAEKIFVVLGRRDGVTVVAKTTSQGRLYKNEYGCQGGHRFPNFHLPLGSCCLPKPTWICFHEFYDFRDTELLQKHFSGTVNRIGTLADGITLELLECALQSEDISGRQTEIVKAALDALRSAMSGNHSH